MQLQTALNRIEASPRFKEWKQKHADTFLASVLIAFTHAEDTGQKFNYYAPAEDRIFTFDALQMNAPQEDNVLKKSSAMMPLDLASSTPLEAARKKAYSIAQKHYATERITTGFAVLQVLDGKQLWNVTFVTANYRTINVRLDSSTGELLSHDMDSLVEFIPGKRTR